MDEIEIDQRMRELNFARAIIELSPGVFDEPEFELGIIHALHQICDEMKLHASGVSIRNYLTSQCEFIFEIAKSHYEKRNQENANLRHWAEPISERLFDHFETDNEELKREFSKLLFLNPAIIPQLIGSEIIEEDYFKPLK